MPVGAPLVFQCVGAVCVCCGQCVLSRSAIGGFLPGRQSEERRECGEGAAIVRPAAEEDHDSPGLGAINVGLHRPRHA